jgi:hypothetical protein
LTPIVEISTEWAAGAKRRAVARSNITALVRDRHVIAFVSSALETSGHLRGARAAAAVER